MITLVWLIFIGYTGELMRDTDAYSSKAACVAEVVHTRQRELAAGLRQSDYWCRSLVLR